MNASSVDSVGSERQEAEGGGVPREEAPPATLRYRLPEISFSVTFFWGLVSKGRFATRSQGWKNLGPTLSIFGLLFGPQLLINARTLMSGY
jgi:hypothetical protein